MAAHDHGAEGVRDPLFLMRVVDRIGIHREIEPFLNVPASLLACLGLTVVGYRVSTGFPEGTSGVTHHVLGVGLSTLLIGLFLMVTRKKAITPGARAADGGERGLPRRRSGSRRACRSSWSSASPSTSSSRSLVLGVLVRRIVDRFESMDVSRLSKLKG